jgi:uncharacterized Fe-S radical SAM superfamily protein PflX
LARSNHLPQDYNETVRYYTTSRINGGVTFKCAFCEHTVTTLNFDSNKGNCRTQAAAAIHQHAAESHSSSPQPLAPIKLVSRDAL